MGHTTPDEATRTKLRIRYAAVGSVVGAAVAFVLVLVAGLVATPDFGIPFAIGIAAFTALWAGTAFGVIFGNAAFEARFGHRTDVEDVIADDAEIHSLATPPAHDRAA